MQQILIYKRSSYSFPELLGSRISSVQGSIYLENLFIYSLVSFLVYLRDESKLMDVKLSDVNIKYGKIFHTSNLHCSSRFPATNTMQKEEESVLLGRCADRQLLAAFKV